MWTQNVSWLFTFFQLTCIQLIAVFCIILLQPGINGMYTVSLGQKCLYYGIAIIVVEVFCCEIEIFVY